MGLWVWPLPKSPPSPAATEERLLEEIVLSGVSFCDRACREREGEKREGERRELGDYLLCEGEGEGEGEGVWVAVSSLSYSVLTHS